MFIIQESEDYKTFVQRFVAWDFFCFIAFEKEQLINSYITQIGCECRYYYLELRTKEHQESVIVYQNGLRINKKFGQKFVFLKRKKDEGRFGEIPYLFCLFAPPPQIQHLITIKKGAQSAKLGLQLQSYFLEQKSCLQNVNQKYDTTCKKGKYFLINISADYSTFTF